MAVAVAVALPFGMVSRSASAAPVVGVNLVLAIDVSGSVDANEYALQRGGYEQAFRSATVQNAILNSQLGAINVTMVEWSGSGQQAQVIGWTTIDSAAASDSFADAIAGITRSFAGQTAVAQAITFSQGLFASAPSEAIRNVIDVSGDGDDNVGGDTGAARDAAVADGTIINGLPIGGPGLTAWYTANVKGGTGSFVVGVDNFADFSAAIEDKLVREITGVPAPASLALFGVALAGLGIAQRRRAA